MAIQYFSTSYSIKSSLVHKYNNVFETLFMYGSSIKTKHKAARQGGKKLMSPNGKIKKVTFAIIAAGALTISAVETINQPSAVNAATAAPSVKSSTTADYHTQALQTLNSFYKPALQGEFPGLKGLTVGKSTRQDVIQAIGDPVMPGDHSDAFDVYHAEMGHPGYAISYKLNKIREMRYFGTNVERESNIGGITVKMLVQQWGAPHSSTVFKNGKITQKKIIYIRGSYQLEFIFNSSTDLDHINLVNKPVA
jgi:hypothetical protein